MKNVSAVLPTKPARQGRSFLYWAGILPALGFGWFLIESHKTLYLTLSGMCLWGAAITWLVQWMPEQGGISIFSATSLRHNSGEDKWGWKKTTLASAAVLVFLKLCEIQIQKPAWIPVLLFLAFLGTALYFLEKHSPAFWTLPDQTPGPRREWPWAEALILLVGSFFLFFRMSTWPHFMNMDSVLTQINGVEYFLKAGTTPFTTGYSQIPSFSFMLEGLAYIVAGHPSYWAGMGLIGAFAAISFLFFYKFLRFYLAKGPALSATLLFATSHWVLFNIRMPWEPAFFLPFEAAALYFFAKTLETGKPLPAAMFGTCLAFIMQFYAASNFVLVFFIASWLALWAFRPREMFRQKTLWALGWGCFLLWTLPMAYYYHHTTEAKMFWMSRMGEVNILPSIKAGNWNPLLGNISRAFQMFNVEAGDTPVYGLAGAPVLAPWEGLCLLAGVAWCLWKAAHPAFFLLFMGFFGGVFTVILTSDPTDATRAMAAAPFAFLLVGIGLDRLSRVVAAPFSGQGRPLVFLFLAGLVALSAAWHYDVYFRQMPRSLGTWSPNYGDHFLAAQTPSSYPPGWNCYMPYSYSQFDHESLFIHEFQGKKLECFYPDWSLPLKDGSAKGNIILLPLGLGRDLESKIHYYYPASEPKPVSDPFGDTLFLLWEVTPQQAADALRLPPYSSTEGIRMSWYDSRNHKLGQWTLPSLFDLEPWFASPPGQPPFPYEKTAYFKVDGFLQDPDKRTLSLETTGSMDWSLGGQKGHLISGTVEIKPDSAGWLPFHIHYLRFGEVHMSLSVKTANGWEPFPSSGLKPIP